MSDLAVLLLTATEATRPNSLVTSVTEASAVVEHVGATLLITSATVTFILRNFTKDFVEFVRAVRKAIREGD